MKRIHSASDNEMVIQIVLNYLCPALYAILNHGLKPTLETAFGDINNSVWQVVEASSQQGNECKSNTLLLWCNRFYETRKYFDLSFF